MAANDVEIEIAGTRVPAILSRRPFYDPDGARMRGAADAAAAERD